MLSRAESIRRSVLSSAVLGVFLTMLAPIALRAEQRAETRPAGMMPASGYGVEVYAVFPPDPPQRPGGISFDEHDNLYVGNFNIPAIPAQDDTARIWIVSPVTRCWPLTSRPRSNRR